MTQFWGFLRSRPALAVTVAVGLVGASAAGFAITRKSTGAGSLEAAEPESGYSLTLDESQRTFTLSSLHIREPGKQIRILEVSALSSPNLQYSGAVVVWPRDHARQALAIGPGFPAPELKIHHALSEAVPPSETNVAPLPGVTLPPPLAIAAGFRVTSGDLGAVNGIRVVYTADGEKIIKDFRQSVIVCVKPRSCATPDGEDPAQRHEAILNQFGLLPKD